jgi:hypothetical protein
MAESALRNLVPSINTAMNNAAQAPFGRPQRIPIYRNEPEFIDRSLNPQNYPVINNPDGSTSSHRMAAEVDENGNWYVFPTIQMQPDGTLRQYDDAREAMKAAFMTGNILSAPNMESALQYAEGGYKVGTPMEQPRSAPAQEPVQPAPESALRQLVPQSAEPFVRSYNPFNPAFRETMRASISDLLGGRAIGGTPTQRYRANIADMLTGAVEMAPGVGEAVGVTDTRQAIRSGDYGTAAILGGATALGMVPVIGDAASRAIREGLDMSTAARMQRAAGQERPFDINQEWYIGTPVNIEATPEKGFRAAKTENVGRDVIFGTDSPLIAEEYSRGTVSFDEDPLTGKFPVIESNYRNQSPTGGVYRVFSGAQNPKRIDAKGKKWFELPMNQITSNAFDEGHDAVIYENIIDSMYNSSFPSNVIVWKNPSDVRSIKAAFDPSKRSSGELLASVAGGAVGLSALNQLVPRNEERRPD